MSERGGARAPDRGPATAAVLRVLADLAATRRQPTFEVPHTGTTPLAWLGLSPLVRPELNSSFGYGQVTDLPVARTPALEALQRHDALTPSIHDLRLGWLWVTGTTTLDGEPRRILLPLLSRPAQVRQLLARTWVAALGPWDLWHLVADADLAADLEARAEFGGGAVDSSLSEALLARLGRLQAWVREVVAASGLPPVHRLLGPVDPSDAPVDGLVVVTGLAVYADTEVDPSHPKATLAQWADDRGSAGTAFASLYVPDPRPAPPAPPSEARTPLASPLPLTDRQTEVVLAARRHPVTVVSGPPGTGKSQTAAAVALDTVANGGSVLVATASEAAADVLAELLERVPGPTPVLFGGGRRASALAAKLADGVAVSDEPRAPTALRGIDARAEALEGAVAARLDGARAQAEWQERSLTLPLHVGAAPVLFDVEAAPGTTVPEAASLVARATAGGDGWWARRRRRRAEARLRDLVGAPGDSDLAAVAAAVELAAARDLARRALTPDDSSADRWRALELVDEERRVGRARATAQWVGQQAESDARRAVAALATALRAGRAGRRAHLARIDVAKLTQALPLWVGTLGDIEALLPATAGAFDLVILDEASQIDQHAAAGALLRARRAVVIGDPRQLRFVSFLADDAVQAAIEAQAAWPLADRLDLRRVSAFDLAASSAPITFLDEHFRSVPHLIGFSAERFYEGRLQVATRHPANERAIAIEVRDVGGERTDDGTNRGEVAAALAEVEAALADPTCTVGVISPYRPQVDALRESIGERIPIEVLQAGRVRVATVHGFQGGECDVVVASFGLSDAGGRRRRFLEDPHLFNVLVTRARHRLVVLASITDPPPGLLADYLRWAATPPSPLPDGPPADAWTASLVDVLRDRGLPARTGYRAGVHVLDLVVGAGPEAMAVATRVHPDGTAAHIGRHLALARLGWRQDEALPTDHDGDPVATALALADRLASTPGTSSLRWAHRT